MGSERGKREGVGQQKKVRRGFWCVCVFGFVLLRGERQGVPVGGSGIGIDGMTK